MLTGPLSARRLLDEEAEGVPGGIEEDAHVLLRLVAGQDRSARQRMCARRIQVVHEEVQVEHLRLLPGLLGPDGRAIPRL